MAIKCKFCVNCVNFYKTKEYYLKKKSELSMGRPKPDFLTVTWVGGWKKIKKIPKKTEFKFTCFFKIIIKDFFCIFNGHYILIRNNDKSLQ